MKLTRSQYVDLVIQITGLQSRDLSGVVQKGQEELDRRKAMEQAKVKAKPLPLT